MKQIVVSFLLLVAAVAASARGESEPIRVGWTAWADGVFVTHLARRIIESELDEPVELVRAGIAEQYQGLASGRLDVMLMSWQPRTHAPYVRRVAGRVEDLGVLYGGARLGWAVPGYVPRDRVASIGDLADPAVRERLDGRIVGIDPGAGLMRLSHRALARYGLDGYTLASGSGPGMSAALEDAVAAGDWVVVTAWSPHWIFAAHELRYLDDPEGVLGGPEQVHALARRGFHAEHPRVAALLARMWLPLDELEHALLRTHEESVAEAVDQYLQAHAERVRYWVTGTP